MAGVVGDLRIKKKEYFRVKLFKISIKTCNSDTFFALTF